jgi:hypothetical protein
MKKLLTMVLMLFTITASAQESAILNQLKADPKKAYGGDYPYPADTCRMTEAPNGYEPFYISHYARHGSRYYWEKRLYQDLDTVMTMAHERQQLTDEGEAFYNRFMAIKDELMTGATELSLLGWEQHQRIARTMYNHFPQVFEKGGNALAISSLSGRSVMSMVAFCQELVQCNPAIEILELSSRFTLDGVVPDDRENPIKHKYPRVTPRWEANKDKFIFTDSLPEKIITRVFTSTDGLPGGTAHIADDLLRLYTSLPNINHEGLMGSIVTDEEIVNRWEFSNLYAYSWVFAPQYNVIPILQDIIRKADAVISGNSDHIADLRFGHDTYLGPLTVLMGLNGADRDPEDPYEVKNTYQNWQTCKASNIQLIFYRSKSAHDDILVKCLLNGAEVSMPVQTKDYPYYKWSDLHDRYTDLCNK